MAGSPFLVALLAGELLWLAVAQDFRDGQCYIGCYKDNGHRDFEKRLPGAYTVTTCRPACKELEYKYFSMQYGDECFCDHDYATPADTYIKVGDEECIRQGHANGEGHGGAWRNSVYEVNCEGAGDQGPVSEPEPNEPEKPDPEEPLPEKFKKECYIGCFKDNGHRDFEKFLTGKFVVPTCRVACQKLGYKYFSVQYGHECFCDKDYSTPADTYVQVADKECIREGYAEGHGGAWRNSVYNTACETAAKPEKMDETPSEVPAPSPDDVMDEEYEFDPEATCYIGCYKDNGHRDFQKMLSGKYTIDTCRPACAKLNYKYFSMQYGHECFCDNSYSTPPDTYIQVDDDECIRQGYAEGHGGVWRNSVFLTECDGKKTDGGDSGEVPGGDSGEVPSPNVNICMIMDKKACKKADNCEYTKDGCMSLDSGCATMEGQPKGKGTKVKGKVQTDCMCKEKCMKMEQKFDAFAFDKSKKKCNCYSDVKMNKKGLKMKKAEGVVAGKMDE